MNSRIALVILPILLLIGCDTVEPDVPPTSEARLLIGNQGNFSSGDGSISVVDLETWEVTTPIRDLESIVQSMLVYGGRLHVIANSGGRVDVFDGWTLERVRTVENLASPRYAAQSFGRLFVSNLYSDAPTFSGGRVSILDADTYGVLNTVEVGDHPEGMAAQGGWVFVANHGFGAGNTISVIDPLSMMVSHTIDAECDGPRLLLTGRDDDLFVTCSGTVIYDDNFNEIGSTGGAVLKINAVNSQVVDRHDLDGQIRAAAFGQDAYLDFANYHLYVIVDERVVKVFDASTLAEIRSIGPLTGDPLGAVTFDSTIDRMYLGRVSGYTTQGSVTVHSPDGAVVRTLPAGVAPTSLLILR
jgi:hypothetical protein